ncbi:MAG: protein kinase domain-containing protein [Pirellulaceae bacterium]
MNTSLQNNTCDLERLESFLSGDLSNVEERDFTLHLNTCESCRRSLQQQAAEPEAWTEAERLLKPSEFDLGTAEADCDSVFRTRSTRQPLQIQNVLSALGPTDDPAMLGRLGGYEVSGVVGAGGMGVVLKAIDKSLDRTVAIKVLAPHLATSGAARKRFAREAKAAAAVLHPNVIAIHSVSNDESLPYLVMPYVRGTSLQKRLDNEGPLSLQEILRIGSQIAAGLAAAHAQGLVHRDIKPANILLEDGVERVTITDFGLARAVDDATITHSGVIAGTPQYMSPEQARGEAVDGRSDLFSLGSVLYAICTGRPPFRAETTYGVMRRITDDEPASIREINPEIPDWLCLTIARLMSKQAVSRFSSATEVSELLEKCLAHVQQPGTVPLPAFLLPPSRKHLFSSVSRRLLGVFAMIATLGLTLLGMVAWQASEAPDIGGKWAGEEWGEVVLEKQEPGEYEGIYTDTFKKNPGTIQLKWSRLEGRYKGTWQEGKDRRGKISVRLVDGEIRGAWTTSEKSGINPGNPELADLHWKRSSGKKEQPDLSHTELTPIGRLRSKKVGAEEKPKPGEIVVDLYGGEDVFKDQGPRYQATVAKIVSSLNALQRVTVNIRPGGRGDALTLAIVRDPYGVCKKEAQETQKASKLEAAINDAIRSGGLKAIRWEGDALSGDAKVAVPDLRLLQPKTIVEADAFVAQAELVMNLGFERNGPDALASSSPVLLQKGQIVPASQFRAYLEREKLGLIRQHGDGATKTTTVRLNVDRDVRFDAVTALMKLCQEVGFQKFALRLEEEAVEKFVLEILRTPFNFDESKGSWQDGAYEMQVLMSLNMVRPRDRVVKTLLKVVDRSEKGTMDQRRLAMMSLGGMAPKQVVPLLIKELEAAEHLPVGQFKTSFPYHEISVLEQIGEEAKDAIPILIEILDLPDGLACESALLALVKIGPSSDDVMNAVAARFGKPEEAVWSRAVYEVGRYGQQAKPLGPTFVKLLSAKPKEARIWAAQALIKSGFDETLGFETLIGDVAKGESADRGLAATALAALGRQAEPMIPKLRAFENDPDAHVAKEVRDAIRRIEKDDRIFTHAEVAAKTAASRKAAADALDQISAETKANLFAEEYQRFEGTWRISVRTIDHAVSLGEFGKDGKHVIKDRQMGDARISLDPSKTPREIDIAFTKGPEKGKILRGIYEWVDDARGTKLVRISVSTNLTDPGDGTVHRPQDFKTRTAVDFAVWEKIKAGDLPIGISPKEPSLTDRSDATELKKFQGTWVLVSSEKDGEEKSEAKNPYGLTFTGTRWKVHSGDYVAVEGTLRLVDVASIPMKLDLLKPRGLGPDPTVDYGIYEWKENTLRYCVRNGPTGSGLPGGMDISKLRPTEFATKDGDGRIIYVWKRAESVGVEESTGPKKSPKSFSPKWMRHLGTVEGLKSIAYSPDGKLIAVANGNVSFPVAEGWKRAVVILDAETGKTVLSLTLATKEENAILAEIEGLPHVEVGPLAFSPDGTILVVGTGLGQVKLFNPKTGELVRSLDDELAKLAEKKTPESLKSLRRAMGGVGSLAFSPEGSLLVTSGSSFEDVARNWGGVRRLGRLVTGPGRLKVWDVKTGVLKHDLAGHSHVEAVSFSADGNLLASAGRWEDASEHGNGVIIWNSQTGKSTSKIVIEANSGTHAVVFSPTNKLVAIGSRHYDKENDTYTTSVSVVYALSGITEWRQTFPGWANPKGFSPDGKSVLTLCNGETIRFIKTETGEVQHEINVAGFLPANPRQGAQWSDFAIAPLGHQLAIAGVDKERKGSVEIWDLGGPAINSPGR